MDKLREIFENKKQEVAEAKAKTPHSELRAMAADMPPCRDFLGALRTTPKDLALIAEVKSASPSQGVIRTEFDPVAIAKSYERAGANCLSVLTDRKYFGGDLAHLYACSLATALPCLRKDFIAWEYQIDEARVNGADAVLLIVAGLEPAQLTDLFHSALSLGMMVLAEVHDEEEMQTVLEMGAPLIGVNNRDLKTLSVDIAVSERLIPLGVGRAFMVCESGLSTRADLERAKSAGADGVLIGTAFCSSPHIEDKVREVMGW